MTRKSAKEAADFIRECVELAEQGDDSLLEICIHFRDQMRARFLFWYDVVPILIEPDRVALHGSDEDGRQQVWLFGRATDGGRIRIVCSIDWDARLITLNWS